jgi:molecular chaperone DnaK
MGDKIPADQKNRLEAAVGRVNEAVKAGEVGEIKSATDALQQTWQEVSTQMYQQAGAQAGAQAGGPQGEPFGGGPGGAQGPQQGEPKEGEDVIDADYEVVDEENK